MTSVLPVARERWSHTRLLTTIAIVFALQVAVIIFVGDPAPPAPRRTSAVPVVYLNHERPPELLRLEDPTLFVLPHRSSFSGDAWMKIPPQRFPHTKRPEPAAWLTLTTQQLGSVFQTFVHTNARSSFQNTALFAPEPLPPALPSLEPVATESSVRIEGDLRGRTLLSVFELHGWPGVGVELLTNSVVQLQVDGEGNTFSATLLQPGSGSSEADRRALDLARAAQFEPLAVKRDNRSGNDGALTSGLMIFEWQTLPIALTNSPATSP